MSWLQTVTELRAGEWLVASGGGAGGEIWSVVATTTTSTQHPSGGARGENMGTPNILPRICEAVITINNHGF